MAGVHVPDSQWRAHVTHSRLQATQARRQASREGSLTMSTAHASMHSRHASAHVQHALSECFSAVTLAVCASPIAAMENNPNKLSKIFRRIIKSLLIKQFRKPTRSAKQFADLRNQRAKAVPKRIQDYIRFDHCLSDGPEIRVRVRNAVQENDAASKRSDDQVNRKLVQYQ